MTVDVSISIRTGTTPYNFMRAEFSKVAPRSGAPEPIKIRFGSVGSW